MHFKQRTVLAQVYSTRHLFIALNFSCKDPPPQSGGVLAWPGMGYFAHPQGVGKREKESFFMVEGRGGEGVGRGKRDLSRFRRDKDQLPSPVGSEQPGRKKGGGGVEGRGRGGGDGFSFVGGGGGEEGRDCPCQNEEASQRAFCCKILLSRPRAKHQKNAGKKESSQSASVVDNLMVTSVRQ